MKKMFSKYIFICLVLFAVCFSACGSQPPASETAGPTAAAVTETAQPETEADQPPDPAEEPPPQEIPLYDEYNIELEIDPVTRIVTGFERIRFTNRTGAPLSEIVVRVWFNAFNERETRKPYFESFYGKIFALGEDFGYMDILHVSAENNELEFALEKTVLTVALDTPLEADHTIQLKIQFDAYIPKIAHRTGANENAIWCGMFLPVLAVYGEDGWHTEPYYPAGDPFFLESANYTVEISTPVEYDVAGTGDKTEEIMEDNLVTTFNARMVRDFAFALSPAFTEAEAVTESGVNIHFYYYSDGLDIEKIMDTALRSMAFMEEEVGFYPYKQLSIVETDMFVSGGMEFSMMVFMDSAYLRRSRSFSSITHETAHQWFYNIVGNDQISEAWLDEGITKFLEDMFFCETEDELREKMEGDYVLLKGVHDGIANEQRIIASGIAGYGEWNDYYQIKYAKAKLMLYSLRHVMGAEHFSRLLAEYFKAFSFRVATGTDFIAMAEEIHGESLKTFFDQWLYSDTLPEFQN